MEIYVLPSLIAICLKLAIFARYHNSLRRENLNLGVFFLAALFLNIIEFVAISPDFSAQTNLLILSAYYCSCVFFLHAHVNLCLEYSQFSWNLRLIKIGMNILLALLVIAIIFNRNLIAGAIPTGLTITKVEGSYYWLIQFYLLFFILFGAVLLVVGSRKLSSNLGRQRCFVMLISTLPPAMVASGVLISQELGYETSAAIFLSFALTIMLCVLVYAEEKTRLFRLLTIVPFTKERKLHKQLLNRITACLSINDDPSKNNSINLREMMKELEGNVVEHVLDYYKGNQKLTASALGVSEATVSRRARAVNGKLEKKQQGSNYENDSMRITQ